MNISNTNKEKNYSEITPQMKALAEICEKDGVIEKELYTKYNVNRGLRDQNGDGVLTGLTEISDVKAKKMENGVSVPCPGTLRYRGYDIKDLARGFRSEDRNGFEEITYLL